MTPGKQGGRGQIAVVSATQRLDQADACGVFGFSHDNASSSERVLKLCDVVGRFGQQVARLHGRAEREAGGVQSSPRGASLPGSSRCGDRVEHLAQQRALNTLLRDRC